jgi:hypothetical protein
LWELGWRILCFVAFAPRTGVNPSVATSSIHGYLYFPGYQTGLIERDVVNVGIHSTNQRLHQDIVAIVCSLDLCSNSWTRFGRCSAAGHGLVKSAADIDTRNKAYTLDGDCDVCALTKTLHIRTQARKECVTIEAIVESATNWLKRKPEILEDG